MKLEKAFLEINRADFVLPQDKSDADLDIPLPIGQGQTISQPTTVKMMLEWLGAQSGEKILDIGSGSGWTTALLSKIVGKKGKVYAVERVEKLKDFGEENCQRAGIKNAKFFLAKEELGLKKYTPYDRILVSAAASSLPEKLLDQLKIGGKMVIPINNSIFEISKKSEGHFEEIEHFGFVFVPLIFDK